MYYHRLAAPIFFSFPGYISIVFFSLGPRIQKMLNKTPANHNDFTVTSKTPLFLKDFRIGPKLPHPYYYLEDAGASCSLHLRPAYGKTFLLYPHSLWPRFLLSPPISASAFLHSSHSYPQNVPLNCYHVKLYSFFKCLPSLVNTPFVADCGMCPQQTDLPYFTVTTPVHWKAQLYKPIEDIFSFPCA